MTRRRLKSDGLRAEARSKAAGTRTLVRQPTCQASAQRKQSDRRTDARARCQGTALDSWIGTARAALHCTRPLAAPVSIHTGQANCPLSQSRILHPGPLSCVLELRRCPRSFPPRPRPRPPIKRYLCKRKRTENLTYRQPSQRIREPGRLRPPTFFPTAHSFSKLSSVRGI